MTDNNVEVQKFIKERDVGWRDYPQGGTLFVRKLRGISIALTDEQIMFVLMAIDETCTHCWDGDSNCQCWNDE